MRFDEWPKYVSAGTKRRRAVKEAAKLQKSGRGFSPISISGPKIARSFWGKAWCDHLESHSDYENRLPRGRSYVRNGSVLDLQITAGQITALVSGSELYEVAIQIAEVKPTAWKALKAKSAGGVGSLIDLLQGKLSGPVMAVMTDRRSGLFPLPAEIRLSCSCPDSARMCKHVAAVLYGIGARLDESPELLFVLRGANHLDLIAEAAESVHPGGGLVEGEMDLAEVFGIEIEGLEPAATPSAVRQKKAKSGRTARDPKKRATPPAKAQGAKKTRGALAKMPASQAAKVKKASLSKKAAPAKKRPTGR